MYLTWKLRNIHTIPGIEFLTTRSNSIPLQNIVQLRKYLNKVELQGLF